MKTLRKYGSKVNNENLTHTKNKESEREAEFNFAAIVVGALGLSVLIPHIKFAGYSMGLSFSLLLSAWSAILGHKFFGSKDTVEKIVVRSLSFARKDGEMGSRTNSFKKDVSETIGKGDGSDKLSLERSLSFKTTGIPMKSRLNHPIHPEVQTL
ncbi:hypothetical protein NC652_041814 [Populus alba x Populus x berolinensis]|nr:hypothetical protein NC652_041814 [Populus alba x Populus x berolinensis]